MAPAIPPPLPPSVEEAYRRKCIQLKQRTNEVEEANDAARVRLARLKRQVEKLRLERAFLLEQLAKRTSTNVEDSDGSPSPPPTPQEKPLRLKRGHRKTTFTPIDMSATLGLAAGSTSFLSQSLLGHSPSSDALSNQPGDAKSNGISKTEAVPAPPKKPATAFELFCDDTRSSVQEKAKTDESINVDEELARRWEELPDKERDEYRSRADKLRTQYEKDKEAWEAAMQRKKRQEKEKDEKEKDTGAAAAKESGNTSSSGSSNRTESEQPSGAETKKGDDANGSASRTAQQEDVEMNDETDDQETQGEKPEE